MLQRPLEPKQYTSLRLTEHLALQEIRPSIGSVGDAYDNALAETTVGSFKTELINRHGPWRDVNHVEVATFEWVDFFNTERPHEYLDDLTPAVIERLHYAHRTLPHPGWVRQVTESPDTPGGLTPPFPRFEVSGHPGAIQGEGGASGVIEALAGLSALYGRISSSDIGDMVNVGNSPEMEHLSASECWALLRLARTGPVASKRASPDLSVFGHCK